jgi:hypothetical protein
MKTVATRTSPVIVPIKKSDLQKEYGLTPLEAKNAVKKMSGLHARRKVADKITRMRGRFDEKVLD